LNIKCTMGSPDLSDNSIFNSSPPIPSIHGLNIECLMDPPDWSVDLISYSNQVNPSNPLFEYLIELYRDTF
jgi:hypothetical protein